MFAGRLMYRHRLDLKFIGRKFFGEPTSPGDIAKANASRGEPDRDEIPGEVARARSGKRRLKIHRAAFNSLCFALLLELPGGCGPASLGKGSNDQRTRDERSSMDITGLWNLRCSSTIWERSPREWSVRGTSRR